MSKNCALQTHAFATLMLVFAACAAALLAHVGIDLAGDFVLAHDSYDGLHHGSRIDALALALVVAFGALLGVLGSALEEARTGRRSMRLTSDGIFGHGYRRFVLSVVVLTLPSLMFMELLDLICNGSRPDDVADLLGGSPLLGLSITIPTAALVALAVRHIAHVLIDTHHSLVAVLGRMIALLARGRSSRQPCPRPDARQAFNKQTSILSRRSGKRGPPLLLA